MSKTRLNIRSKRQKRITTKWFIYPVYNVSAISHIFRESKDSFISSSFRDVL